MKNVNKISYSALGIDIRYADGKRTHISFMFAKNMEEIRLIYWQLVHKYGLEKAVPGCART